MALNARYRLVALDMDGTLLNSDHQITPYTGAVLEHAAKAGVKIALSTGRCRSELQTFLKAIPGITYVIGENGAWVYDVAGDASVAQIRLSDECVDMVFEHARTYDIFPQVFINGQSFMPACDENTLLPYHIEDFASVFRSGSSFVEDVPGLCQISRGFVEKINLYFRTLEDREAFMANMADLPVVLSTSIGFGCEISPQGVTKSLGLEVLCDYIGIPMASAMAVGDGGNDLDIMGVAGLSVAMGNAIEPVKALAHIMTEDNDHDGAAHAIERHVLSATVMHQ